MSSNAEEGGELASLEEKKRLEELLASFPTTEAEDKKLLTGLPLILIVAHAMLLLQIDACAGLNY